LRILDFPTTGKEHCLVAFKGYQIDISWMQKSQNAPKGRIDFDLHLNDTLTFSAVYSERTFGVQPSFCQTWSRMLFLLIENVDVAMHFLITKNPPQTIARKFEVLFCF
jgi:hypothetical protein